MRSEHFDDDELTGFIQLATDKEAVDVNCTHAFDGSSTPLILLCVNNQSDSLDHCVKILLRQRPDIDVNQTDKDGLNDLMILCQWSKSVKIVQVAQMLISNGAYVIQTNKYGMNALMWLCWHSISDKIVEMAQLLITSGTDVKKTDEKGMNALMLLCYASNSEKIVQVSQLLIENGIDLKQAHTIVK